jgi:hypothetical protein
MDGEPVYLRLKDGFEAWAIVLCEKDGSWAGIPFAIGQYSGVKFEWDIKKRGIKCYRSKQKEEV